MNKFNKDFLNGPHQKTIFKRIFKNVILKKFVSVHVFA